MIINKKLFSFLIFTMVATPTILLAPMPKKSNPSRKPRTKKACPPTEPALQSKSPTKEQKWEEEDRTHFDLLFNTGVPARTENGCLVDLENFILECFLYCYSPKSSAFTSPSATIDTLVKIKLRTLLAQHYPLLRAGVYSGEASSLRNARREAPAKSTLFRFSNIGLPTKQEITSKFDLYKLEPDNSGPAISAQVENCLRTTLSYALQSDDATLSSLPISPDTPGGKIRWYLFGIIIDLYLELIKNCYEEIKRFCTSQGLNPETLRGKHSILQDAINNELDGLLLDLAITLNAVAKRIEPDLMRGAIAQIDAMFGF